MAAVVLTWLAAVGCDQDAPTDAQNGSTASAQAPAPSSSSAPPPSAVVSPLPVERSDAAAPDGGASGQLVIVAGGDVNLGRSLGQSLLRGEDANPFQHIEPVLRSADLVFVNLESQLSDQDGETQSPRNPLIFTGPPQGADLLLRAGIDVVSFANNHAWDYGRKALRDTLANLRRVGVSYVGASEQPGRMYEPTVLRVRGWSVAWFAVTHIWNHGPFEEHLARDHVAWARFDILKDKLARARREHDVLLLSYHGGSEYLDMPMQWTREFVRAVMLAKVDAVIGHHPHVPHGVGWFEQRPAFYSLGNLVFHMHRDYPWTGTSFLARLTFRRSGRGVELEAEACPYHILGVTPMLFDGSAKAPREQAFRRHLQQLSVTVGRTQVGEPGQHSCMRLEPPKPRRRRSRVRKGR